MKPLPRNVEPGRNAPAAPGIGDPGLSRRIPLGRVLGIPIGLHYSWFLVFALSTWLLASVYYPAQFGDWPPVLCWLMGAMTAILFFASLLLHELAHSVVAMRLRVPVRRITLFIFGGLAEIGAEPPSAGAELAIALAGPLANFALAFMLKALRTVHYADQPLAALAEYLVYMNMAIALFNLIPAYPLDGGRVLRALVWAVTRNRHRSTLVAAAVGRGFGFFFIFLGMSQALTGHFTSGLWVALIGWFLERAAAHTVQTTLQTLLAGHTVRQAMSSHWLAVPETVPLRCLVEQHFSGVADRDLLVNRGEQPVGLLYATVVREALRAGRADVAASQAMVPLEQASYIGPDTELLAAARLLGPGGAAQLVVVGAGGVVGTLSRRDLGDFLQALQSRPAERA